MEDNTEPSFIKRDDITEALENSLKKHFERPIGLISSTFDPSHITECPRRIIYRCNGTNHKASILSKREAVAEKWVKSEWRELFRTCNSVKMHNDDMSVSDCNCNLVGNLDFVLGVKNTLLATKIYSIDSDTFQKIQKKGAIRKDVIEVMVYM